MGGEGREVVSPLVPVLGSGDIFSWGEVGVEKACKSHPSQLRLSPAMGDTTFLVSPPHGSRN